MQSLRMQSLQMQSLRDSGDDGGGSGGSLVDAPDKVGVGSPRARPLTEPETHRLIHVDVVEDVEGESDDDMDRAGDVDEYSVSDVAGEATDEDFELIMDEVGDLVEFVPEEDGEGFAGEEREDVEDGGVSPVFHEAVEVAADGAAAVARDESYESAEGGRTQAEDAV